MVRAVVAERDVPPPAMVVMMPVAGCDLADAVVVGVGEVEVVGGVEGQAGWGVDGGGEGGAVVACVGLGAVSGDGGDGAGGEVELADAVVVGVGDIEIRRVGGEGGREAELGGEWLGRCRRRSRGCRFRRWW